MRTVRAVFQTVGGIHIKTNCKKLTINSGRSHSGHYPCPRWNVDQPYLLTRIVMYYHTVLHFLWARHSDICILANAFFALGSNRQGETGYTSDQVKVYLDL